MGERREETRGVRRSKCIGKEYQRNVAWREVGKRQYGGRAKR